MKAASSPPLPRIAAVLSGSEAELLRLQEHYQALAKSVAESRPGKASEIPSSPRLNCLLNGRLAVEFHQAFNALRRVSVRATSNRA